MYQGFSTVDGVTAVQNYLEAGSVTGGPDGLIFAPPGSGILGELDMPLRLLDWLIDIRLLRRIPLAYLVPDAALLPAESIRTFHVDPTWVDRVVDGVFSAANTGTVDAVFNYSVLAAARQGADDELTERAKALVPGTNWTADDGMTGILIRSDLARRWPDMIVGAWNDFNMNTPIPVLRSEPVSRDIYIALFAGTPQMVTIREPFSGVRFGVEPVTLNSQTQYKVDSRQTNGINVNPNGNPVPLTIPWRNAQYRTINFSQFATQGVDNSPRQVALNLEQRPYLQEFKDFNTHQDEQTRGSQELTPQMQTITFRKGRYMKLDALRSRLTQQQKMAGA